MLRFFHNRSQTQIAEELGISQMHVSRLLAPHARRNCAPAGRRLTAAHSSIARVTCGEKASTMPTCRHGRRPAIPTTREAESADCAS